MMNMKQFRVTDGEFRREGSFTTMAKNHREAVLKFLEFSPDTVYGEVWDSETHTVYSYIVDKDTGLRIIKEK